MLIYLRPDVWALSTALFKDSVFRTLASLTNIGRLTPAKISTFALSITDIARLDGVPPNISVNSITPSPSSALIELSKISNKK